MAENIILEPGARVKQSGKAYRVTDTAVITGDLEEVRQQTNRHRAMWCPDSECRSLQTETKRARGVRRAGPDIFRACSVSAMPACGMCGKPLVWQGTVDNSTADTE